MKPWASKFSVPVNPKLNAVVLASWLRFETSTSACAFDGTASARTASASSSARAPRERRRREDRCGPLVLSRDMTHPVGSRLSALGSRLSALGSRLSALGSRLSALGSRLSALGSRLSALGSRLSALGSRLSALGSRLSALGSRLSALGSRLSALGSRLSALSLLSASATGSRGPLRPSMCRHHAPRRGTTPSHSRGRHPRLRRGHRPSAARRGMGPSPPPDGRAVSRPTRPWCAVTASLVAYPVEKSLRLKPCPFPLSRVAILCGQYNTKKFYESNAYNFTPSIGIPRTTCKFDEYQGSPAHRRRAPARRPRVRALARPCLGPAAVAHLPGHADAPSRPACRQLPPRREGRGRGVHERGIARTSADTLHGIVAGAPWHGRQPCGWCTVARRTTPRNNALHNALHKAPAQGLRRSEPWESLRRQAIMPRR